VPSILAQTTRTVDPVLRDTRSFLKRIKSRIPGWSETLEARRNLWGERIILSGGLGPDIISPIYSSESKNDPVANELVRLKHHPSLPQRTLSGTEIPDNLYWQFVEDAGKPAHQVLEILVTDPIWKALDSRPSIQKKLISQVIDKFRNKKSKAKEKLVVAMGEYLTKQQKTRLVEELKIGKGLSEEEAEEWIHEETEKVMKELGIK